jgi:hypothetical protein
MLSISPIPIQDHPQPQLSNKHQLLASTKPSSTMAPVIWGLDLSEMKWGKFKGSYMFNKTYHLRCTKMIVYQIAMILCVVSESVGTDAISKFNEQQNKIQALDPRVYVSNNDFIGIASFNIFMGITVATIFGSGFFFDLFWPERHESKAVRLAWKISSVVTTIALLADALALTVIVAKHEAYIEGVDEATAAALYAHSPFEMVYRRNARCIATVVLLWPGFVATVASTIILFKSHAHDDVHGPLSRVGRQEREAEKTQAQV